MYTRHSEHRQVVSSRDPLSPPEVIGGIGAAVVAGAYSAWKMASVWFYADFWGLLANHDLTLNGLLSPHGGHLAVFHVASAQVGYRLFGFDSQVWFALLRSVVWSSLILWIWVWLRREGVDRRVGLVFLATFLLFGLSGWVAGWLIGNPLAIGFIIAAVATIGRHPAPSIRHSVVVGCLLVAAASSTSLGLAGLAGVAGGLLLVRHRGGYWWSCLGAGSVYLGWYVTLRGGDGPPVSMGAGGVGGLARDLWGLLLGGYTRIFGDVAGSVIGTAMILVLLYALIKGPFPARALAAWVFTFVGMVALTRVAGGQAQVTAPRYGYLVVLISSVVAALLLQTPDRRRATAMAWLLAVVLLAVNVAEFDESVDFFAARSNQSRQIVEAAVSLVGDGEPYWPDAPIDRPRAGMLNAGHLARFADNGWRPSAVDPEALLLARGQLRTKTEQTSASCDVPSTGNTPTTWAEAIVAAPGSVTLRYTDSFGLGEYVVAPGDGLVVRAYPGGVLSADPVGGVMVCVRQAG